MTAQPFPFASLPVVSREELALRRSVRAAAQAVSVEAVATVLAELVDEPVAIRIERVGHLSSPTLAAEGVATLLAPADTDDLRAAIAVEAEAALAATIVARALRHRAPRIVDGSRGPSPEIAGAFAAIILAAARRVHPRSLRVVSAGPASALSRDLHAIHGQVVTVWLSVTLGRDTFSARVGVPMALVPAQMPTSTASLATADVPLALPLVVASCLADRVLLTSLRTGDIFVVPRFPLDAAGDSLGGPVALVAPRAERGLRGQLGHDGRLVLGSVPIGAFAWSVTRDATAGGEQMPEDPNPTLAVLEDAPVVVRIELGAVEMPAREWASLAAGDVISVGRQLGSPAILRVAGVEVARGELVSIDGEYGVRILPRGGEDR